MTASERLPPRRGGNSAHRPPPRWALLREAEERNENDRFYAYERSYGSFSRSFTLPDGADVEHADADLKNGVLMISIPKRPEHQPHKIQLRAGEKTKH